MDAVRIGLSFRALRRRRRLTQSALGALVGLSHSTIARIERGHAERVTLRTLMRIAHALGASVSVRVLWPGEALDRLLDAAHADITDTVLRLLRDAGWEVATEVSFSHYGATALPARTVAVRRWLKRPTDALAGILFLSYVHHASARHRRSARQPGRRA